MTPKHTRLRNDKDYKNLRKKLSKIPFNKYAVESGFKQRKEQKIEGKSMLLAFIMMAMQGKNTFQHWSEQMASITGKTVSRQGLWKRVTSKLTKFLSVVLIAALGEQTKHLQRHVRQYCSLTEYKRVLLQDSTTITLPTILRWCFPGNVVKGIKKSQLKIQVIYDMLHNNFLHFEITPFRANDQSRARSVLAIASKKDLVIRDLGYFVLDIFNEMSRTGISFISRVIYGITAYDTKTGIRKNLYKEIRKNKGLDKWVILGGKKNLNVRLVAIRLPEQQANYRRRKARENKDIRSNHSKEYYELLGYDIFITTENETILTTKQIASIYGLRWRIESIFKCWKSHFHLQELIPFKCSLTKQRVEAIIYMMLIFIVMFQVNIYNFVLMKTEKLKNCFISLFKLCKYVANNIFSFLEHPINLLLDQIIYYCRYDKRKKRINYAQKFVLG